MTEFPEPTPNIKLTHPDGRSAIIDFGDDKVMYSGNLPVDESAKLFFEALFKRILEARNAK